MIRNKRVMLSIGVMLLLTILLSVSYATFVLSTGKYKSSELLIAELLYGINIEEDGSSESAIEGNKIIIPGNTKSYFLVTVSSLNEIDSKYTLGYKSSSNNTVVKYTDKTPWTPEGYLERYESTTHSKTVRIVIENKESSEVEVSLKVYGGYTFNSIESINLKDGYKTISGIYNEVVAINNKNLVNRIGEENECKENEECKYSGGSINNYLQYPEDTDKSKNLWRIIGTYNIDNNKVAKIVSEEITATKRNEITSSLTSFYKTLDNGDKYIESTNKFNCSESGCIESTYNKIGLISTYEYERIGSTSYLEAKENYFAINNTNIQNITKGGIKETEESTISGLKPSVYLKSEVKVKGRGTSSDPYIIVREEENDINIVAVKLLDDNNQEVPLTSEQDYEWLIQNKVIDHITCENNTQAQWDDETGSITLTNVQVPDYCTVVFKEGNKVSISSTSSEIVGNSVKYVKNNGEASFQVKTIGNYSIKTGTLTCDDTNVTTSINTTTGLVTIAGITQDTTCTLEFEERFTVTLNIVGGSESQIILNDVSSTKYTYKALTPDSSHSKVVESIACEEGITGTKGTAYVEVKATGKKSGSCTVTMSSTKYCFAYREGCESQFTSTLHVPSTAHYFCKDIGTTTAPYYFKTTSGTCQAVTPTKSSTGYCSGMQEYRYTAPSNCVRE